MAKTQNTNGGRLGELRAKAALFDELVEQLAQTEEELERVRHELVMTRRAATRDGIDPAWREIANDLAGALRPYTMLSLRGDADGCVCPGNRAEDAADERAARKPLADESRARSSGVRGRSAAWGAW